MNFIETIKFLGKDSSVENRRRRLLSLIKRTYVLERNDRATNIVLPAKKKARLTLMAHYDLYPHSRGYNDNGLVVLLSLQNLLPDYVEVVFTDKEEQAGLGSNFYMENHKPEFVINIDVAGAGEVVQFAKYPVNSENSFEFIPTDIFETIERFAVPFSDNYIVKSFDVPSMLIFAGIRGDERQAIGRIWNMQHGNVNDDKIELLSEDILQAVSNFTRDTIMWYMVFVDSDSDIIKEEIMKVLKEEQILEFSNFMADETGLTSGTIYVSEEEKRHLPRIKYYRGVGSRGDSATIKISKPPEVIEKASSFKLNSREKKEIFAFINKNYDHLLYYWKNVRDMSNEESVAWGRKIKKIC